MLLYVTLIIIGILLIFNIFLYYFGRKIDYLEFIITMFFEKRLGIIPCLFELSKKYIVKHSNVFDGIIKVLKTSSTIDNKESTFSEKIYMQSLVHHELDFLFKIFNKHDKLTHNYKFIYLRDLTIDNSFEIGKRIILYKNIIKKYNRLVKINRIFLFGFLFGMDYKREI